MTSQPQQPRSNPSDRSEQDHSHQAGSDEADREKESTPAGVAGDLEDKAEEIGASTAPPQAGSTPEPGR
jgi:hypothetical protein